jgi:hypothetical protein
MSDSKPARKQVDWDVVANDIRAGILTDREIGAKHGRSHGAIQQYAKKHGIERDLSERIRQKTDEKLARAALAKEISQAAQMASSAQIVEAVATLRADVQIYHQHKIAAAEAVVASLWDELGETSQARGEIEQSIENETEEDKGGQRRAMMLKAVSLSSRASTAANLANALKSLIGLRRQAHGMNDDSGNDEPATKSDIASAVRKLNGDQREQLRSIAQSLIVGSGGDAS